MPRNTIDWFDIPATDIERARTFYGKLLDAPMGDVYEVMPGHMSFLFPMEVGGAGGSAVQGEGYVPTKEGSLIYLNANPDLQAVLDRVEEAGGQVMMPKTDIGGDNGYMAWFIDSEGNKIGLHSQE